MRTASASYYTAADLYSVGYEIAKALLMQLWNCFTVSPFWSACLAMHQTTMKRKGRQLQRACKTRWLSSEATVGAMSEILAIWAALKQLSGNENDAMCVVSPRLIKTKNFNMMLSFCQHWHLTWQNWAKFFRRDVLTLQFAQVKASVELCINKLYGAAAESEFKADCEQFGSELGELGKLGDLADSCVSSGMAFWKD